MSALRLAALGLILGGSVLGLLALSHALTATSPRSGSGESAGKLFRLLGGASPTLERELRLACSGAGSALRRGCRGALRSRSPLARSSPRTRPCSAAFSALSCTNSANLPPSRARSLFCASSCLTVASSASTWVECRCSAAAALRLASVASLARAPASLASARSASFSRASSPARSRLACPCARSSLSLSASPSARVCASSADER